MARTRWLSREEQAAWRVHVRSTQLLNEALDRQLQRDSGMPTTYFGILVSLSEAPGRTLRMTDLAHTVRFSPSRMTHAIASLERRGWVRRARCGDDRRSLLATITPAGLRAIEAAAPGHVAEVRKFVFDRLTAEQVSQLEAICDTILEGLDPIDTCPTEPDCE